MSSSPAPPAPPPPPPPQQTLLPELTLIIDVGSIPYALRARRYEGEGLLRLQCPSLAIDRMPVAQVMALKLHACSLIKQMAKFFRLCESFLVFYLWLFSLFFVTNFQTVGRSGKKERLDICASYRRGLLLQKGRKLQRKLQRKLLKGICKGKVAKGKSDLFPRF